jgi:small multidrug resistance family-3 protein
MPQFLLLILAAILEVGGDALIRNGLKSGGLILMIAGVVVLAAYGFMVNLTKLDFSRLMGLYIVLFFVVSQVIAVVIFKEKLHVSLWIGGAFVVIGGAIMTFWTA